MPTTTTKKTRKKKVQPVAAQTSVLHAKNDDGDALVGIGNLRVLITIEDGLWFAQGLEIDYAAQGNSLDDVRSRFENGLMATVNEHLRIYGKLDNLLHPAPPEMWSLFLVNASQWIKQVHTQVTIHPKIHEALKIEQFDYLVAA